MGKDDNISKSKTPQQIEDEEFLKTGSFTVNLSYNIKVTEEDLVKDLVKNTEGKMIEVLTDLKNNNQQN